ncbi:MAG: class I SAM-dependent methyltransferase [Mariprofundaceae bacterium]|nr:class I SAM-dependent methyltransferase [Mariprofundaceae bacterium]
MLIEQRKHNIHISYDLPTRIYHRKVAALTDKYSSKGAAILDIGAGAGNMLAALHQRRPDLQLFSADAYQDALDVVSAKVVIKGEWLLSEGKLDLSNIDQRFDTIVMSHVLEHVWNPVDAVLQAMACLNVGGRLVLAVPNAVTPANIMKHMFRCYPVNEGHCFLWDRAHWVNFLEQIVQADVLEYGNDEVFLFKRKTTSLALKKIEVSLATMFPALSFSHLAVIQPSASKAGNE